MGRDVGLCEGLGLLLMGGYWPLCQCVLSYVGTSEGLRPGGGDMEVGAGTGIGLGLGLGCTAAGTRRLWLKCDPVRRDVEAVWALQSVCIEGWGGGMLRGTAVLTVKWNPVLTRVMAHGTWQGHGRAVRRCPPPGHQPC